MLQFYIYIRIGESWDEQLSFTVQKAIDTANTAQDGKVDWQFVKRSVCSAEPPRIEDVDAHIAFCKTWGGGSSLPFMARTLEYIEMKMKSASVVVL